ncbi:hypothetical protein M0R45_009469 [Rubus argutus]|uniref:Uncharacterized protein n=1 Tax=Rubus argutus TaxID=59490 RepID=A0AAW1Y7Z8_RUBAR
MDSSPDIHRKYLPSKSKKGTSSSQISPLYLDPCSDPHHYHCHPAIVGFGCARCWVPKAEEVRDGCNSGEFASDCHGCSCKVREMEVDCRPRLRIAGDEELVSFNRAETQLKKKKQGETGDHGCMSQ